MQPHAMHKRIIATANELGYFPTIEQADEIWHHWQALGSAARPRDTRSNAEIEEFEQRTMRECIETVLNPIA